MSLGKFASWLFVLGTSMVSFAEAAPKVRRPIKPVVVRDIYVEQKNVFDPNVPGEDMWLFRWANRFHIQTRASVIRRELLFRPGDRSDTEHIQESERNLRALPFIKDATLRQRANPDGSVDLTVTTQDSWTTQPQFNVSSEGGQTIYSAGFEEINLLGYGKHLSYFYKEDEEGVGHEVGYSDPQFLNTRWRFTSSFEDIPTGDEETVNLDHPFYSLTTRVAGGVPLNRSRRMEKILEDGVEVSRHEHDHLEMRPYTGLWVNRDPLNVWRLTLTYRYTEDFYQSEAATLPSYLPSNQALSGPILAATFTQSDFIKETFIDKTGRTEDINLGHEAQAGVGYVGRTLGATENSIPFSVNDAFGFGNRRTGFGLMSFGTSSRYYLYSDGQTGGRLMNALYFANFNYYRHLRKDFPMTGVLHAESAYVQNPDVENLLTLGGNSGLRGFKNDFMTGNKSLLMNLETRFYYPKEVFHLAYVGGAAFIDAGQVQPQGYSFTRQDFHANVGVGMRFGLTRSAEGTVLRVDLAYALGPIQQSNRWILSVSSAQGFKREANTYKNFVSAKSTQ